MSTTDVVRHPPKQARSNASLRKLADAARLLYNTPSVGRDRLTTALVSELAGVSIGTVYRYFPDRVALLDYIAPDRDQAPAPEPDQPEEADTTE
jgi:hypothetical protein